MTPNETRTETEQAQRAFTNMKSIASITSFSLQQLRSCTRVGEYQFLGQGGLGTDLGMLQQIRVPGEELRPAYPNHSVQGRFHGWIARSTPSGGFETEVRLRNHTASLPEETTEVLATLLPFTRTLRTPQTP
jgi:hypothetical protein